MDVWVEFLATERHLWLSDRRFDAAEITNPLSASRLLKDTTMQLQNLGQREVAHQLSRR